MPTSLTGATNNKIGTCPHGLPLGACPICNGMGGGSSVKKDNKPREMTWNECYAIGQMLKAQKMARKHTLQMYATQDLNAYLNRLQEQVNNPKIFVTNNFPKPIAKAITIISNVVLLPAIKILSVVTNEIKNIFSNIQKNIENIKNKLTDISDKLTSLFGEAKAAIEKKISEKFKDIKKKIFNIFGLSSAENEEDEELKKIEEEKRLYELNTAKETLFEKKQPQEQNTENFQIESEEK